MSLIWGCNEPHYVPKPRMYPKVEYPTGEKVRVSSDFCDFSFEFPEYGTLRQETSFFDEKPKDPCWFDLNIENLNAQLHCSYSPIKEGNFDQLVNDAFKLTAKHNSKAEFRKESLIENQENNVYGLLFELEGPVATPIQFYLSDSTNHFFRASLYYNDKVNPDSTQVITEFLFEDIQHLIETFRWK